MPPRFRLSRGDFKNMRGFRRLQGSFFSLSFGRIPGRASPGAATVVSAKVAPRAVVRNRIRRRSRAIMSEVARSAPASMVFVIIAKKGAGGASFDAAGEDLRNLISRATSGE